MSQEMVDCPVCKNEVPLGAPRCKHCFSDLGEYWEGSPGPGITGPLVALLLITLVCAGAVGWAYSTVYSRTELGAVTVDTELERLVLVYTSADVRHTTRQVDFDDIKSVEMEGKEIMLAGVYWSVYVVVDGDERVLLNRQEGAPLEQYANRIQQRTGKPLTITKPATGAEMSGAF